MRKFIVISAIVIALMPAIILPALAVGALASEYGFFENYSKWKEVEIPTETELRATLQYLQTEQAIIKLTMSYILQCV